MTVAYDLASNIGATTGDCTGTTWSHGGAAANVKGVLVYIAISNSNTPPVGVTYGGAALTKIAEANDTSTEKGNCTAWFLGVAVAQGARYVTVDVGSSQLWCGACITVTGVADTETYYGVVQENAANPSPTVTVPATFVSYPTAGMYSGLAAPTDIAAGTGYTAFGGVDQGNDVAQFERYTTGTVTGTPTINFTSATDDCAMVAVAMGEVQWTPVDPMGASGFFGV